MNLKSEQVRTCYAASVPIAGSMGQPGGLARIMLTPWGSVDSKNGTFVVNDESAKLIVAAFAAGQKDIPIDFEHTTEGGDFATQSGAAPASGWITAIVPEAGVGIFALVKWNDKARAMIQADEYRYLSPVVVYRKKDLVAVEITSAALTNKPAIVEMLRVAAKENHAGDDDMDLKLLRTALTAAGVQLADDATDEIVLAAAVAKLGVKVVPPDLSPVAYKLGLAKDADVATIAAKVDGLLKETVPASEYKAVSERLAVIEQRDKDRESQTLVAKAIEEAKLNPNDEKQMTWARSYAKSDPAGFDKWSEAATAIPSTNRIIKPSATLDGEGPKNRATMIASAKAEHVTEKFAKGFDRRAWIDNDLRRAGLDLLTDKEAKEIV